MHHILRRISVVIVLGLALVSCTPQTPQVDTSVVRHPLWVMESDHGKVYLMGSVHMLSENHYPLPQVMEDAYRDSQSVAFETDLSAAKSPELQQKLLMSAIYTNGKSLKETVSPKLFARVQDTLKRLGQEPDSLTPFRPWFCAITLEVLDFEAAGNKAELGLDAHFEKKARQDGKAVVYFEEAEFQLELFTSLIDGDQEEYLERTLDSLQVNGSNEGKRMLQYWQAGDAEGLYRDMERSFRGVPELEKRLLTSRNRNWVPLIEKLAKRDGNALVVVGAGHLVGPKSVVALLRKKGYRIKQM